MLPTLREVPFFRLLVPLCMGILVQHVLHYTVPYPIFVSIISLILAVLLSNTQKIVLFWQLSGFMLNLACLFLGIHLSQHYKDIGNEHHYQKHLHQSSNKIVVTLTEAPSHSPKTIRIKAKVESIQDSTGKWNPAKGNIFVYIQKDSLATSITYPSHLVVEGKIQTIPPAKNPAAFDFQHYSHLQNNYYQLYAPAGKWAILSQKPSENIFSYAYYSRNYLLHFLEKHIPTENEYSVASALILGHRSDMSDELVQAYSHTGATHVLSVSGLHIGIFAAILDRLFRSIPASKRTKKYVFPILTILIIWAFGFISGASPSVLRACMMFSLLGIGKFLDRPNSSYNILAASAFLLLLSNPFLLFDIGFQLSYLGVFGILYLYNPIYQLWTPPNRVLVWLWEGTAVAIAATIATMPLTLYYFHQFPVYFWLSNFVAMVGAMVILIVGILLFLLGNIPVLGVFIGTCLYWATWFMNVCIFAIDRLPMAVIEGFWLKSWEALLLGLMFMSLSIAFMQRHKKAFYLSLSLLLVLSASSFYRTWTIHQQRFFTVYHTTQGYAASLVEGKNAVLVVDSNLIGKKNLKMAIQNHLWQRGFHFQDTILMGNTTLFKNKNILYKKNFLYFYNKSCFFALGNRLPKKLPKVDYIFVHRLKSSAEQDFHYTLIENKDLFFEKNIVLGD